MSETELHATAVVGNEVFGLNCPPVAALPFWPQFAAAPVDRMQETWKLVSG